MSIAGTTSNPGAVEWRWALDPKAILILAGSVALFAITYDDAIRELVRQWTSREEYSHGFLIPLISIFLVWQKKDELAQIDFSPSWSGFVVLLLALGLYAAGTLSTLFVIVHYSLLMAIAGFALSFAGWRFVRVVWAAFFLLIFMVPLPPFLYNNLSQQLQLISSELGVAVIRLFDISVFLEGNVIDLGTYKLQVVEACNGLRYLFPLMSFGFLAAYFFRARFWMRLVVFLSTIPITVLMNSFRIGVIGLLVDRFGTDQAEGFLHDFEGWVIFMACVGLLMLEMWALIRLTGDERDFRDVFYLDMPPAGKRVNGRPRRITTTAVAALAALTIAAVSSQAVEYRPEEVPLRTDFADFPMAIGEWNGERDQLDPIYLPRLDLTDYVLANYRNPAGGLVNYYVAYYASQRAGAAAHSPRSCIPGGGWEIEDLSTVRLDTGGGRSHPVNRVQISMADNRQLVYYWFEQRGRVLTSEYLVKWFLFWDALTRNRSDGALVRLTTPVAPGEDWASGDRRLQSLSAALGDRLHRFVPE